jgi:hypothetical protein
MNDWNVVCDRCGFQYKSYQLFREWTGHMVCRKCLDPREFEPRIKEERNVTPIKEPDIHLEYAITEFMSPGSITITGTDMIPTGIESLSPGSLSVTGTDLDVGGMFLAFTDTDSGESRIAISLDDGETWALTTLSNTGVGWNPGAAWNGTRWVALAPDSSGEAMDSTDSVSWSDITFPAAASLYQNIKYGGAGDRYFLACAHSVGLSQGISVKSNAAGTSWTSHNIGQFTNVRALVWSDSIGLWVAAGGLADAGLRVLTSPDGETWTSRTADNAIWWNGIWTGTKYILISPSGFITSSDGITWSSLDGSASGTHIAVNDDGVIVTCGSQTAFVSTDNGDTWNSYDMSPGPPGGGQYSSVAWNGKVFCAVSYDDGVTLGQGYSATSPDGTVWTERHNMPSTDNWVKIVSSYHLF